MAKARARQPKTRKNAGNVEDFIRGVEDDQRRKDTRAVVRLMRKYIKKLDDVDVEVLEALVRKSVA